MALYDIEERLDNFGEISSHLNHFVTHMSDDAEAWGPLSIFKRNLSVFEQGLKTNLPVLIQAVEHAQHSGQNISIKPDKTFLFIAKEHYRGDPHGYRETYFSVAQNHPLEYDGTSQVLSARLSVNTYLGQTFPLVQHFILDENNTIWIRSYSEKNAHLLLEVPKEHQQDINENLLKILESELVGQ